MFASQHIVELLSVDLEKPFTSREGNVILNS